MRKRSRARDEQKNLHILNAKNAAEHFPFNADPSSQCKMKEQIVEVIYWSCLLCWLDVWTLMPIFAVNGEAQCPVEAEEQIEGRQ